MRDESVHMIEDLLAFMRTYESVETAQSEGYEECFNTIALRLFKFQFKYNVPYKKFCQLKRKTPLSVKHWQEIPPMPIQGFKELTLSCETIEEAKAVFTTSGTTNPEKKGRNYHPTFAVWDVSMKGPYKQFVLPDRELMTTLVISPTADLNPNSSLSRYLSHALTEFGTEGSQSFFTEEGLDLKGLVKVLRKLEEKGEPVLLIGATFAYVHLMDYLREETIRFTLAETSRIFDTGGFKGKSREVEMEALYQDINDFFCIPRSFCVNMYGMTELCSQMYDQTIRSQFYSEAICRDKKGPAWTRTVVLDTNTLKPVERGQVGVLAHYDLANWNACLAILTEDLGYETDKGFVLLGRVEGSEARGCSIAVDQLLQASKL